MSAVLALRGIAKRYGSVDALKDIELDVEKGSFLSLLGPSGCGKTTLLRIIAGILLPDTGDVILNERRVSQDPPFARDLSMVFQDYALFPHMNVFENVAFGIRMRGNAEQKRQLTSRVHEVLDLVRLRGFETRLPAELSGGQQQRVAIARALAPKPALLLMDEPLSNLDAKVREEMRSELKDIQRKTAVTTVYVTHDQEEALALSDTVVVMSRGRIAQIGRPLDLYSNPRDQFVAGFIGKANILEGTLSANRRKFEIGKIMTLDLADAIEGSPGAVAIRPEQIILATDDSSHASNSFAAVITRESYTGALTYLDCEISGITITVLKVNRVGDKELRRGQTVHLTIPSSAIRLLPRKTDPA